MAGIKEMGWNLADEVIVEPQIQLGENNYKSHRTKLITLHCKGTLSLCLFII